MLMERKFATRLSFAVVSSLIRPHPIRTHLKALQRIALLREKAQPIGDVLAELGSLRAHHLLALCDAIKRVHAEMDARQLHARLGMQRHTNKVGPVAHAPLELTGEQAGAVARGMVAMAVENGWGKYSGVSNGCFHMFHEL